MLYTQTGKIKISTVGASFTVTFSVAPDEIDFLTALHEQYAEMNMSGFTIKPSDSEKPNNCEDVYPCDTCVNKGDHNGECSNCVVDSEPIRLKTPSHYKPKTEPQTEKKFPRSTEKTIRIAWVDEDLNELGKTEPQTGKCPHYSICAKPCKECGACDKECGMWEILKAEPQTERSE